MANIQLTEEENAVLKEWYSKFIYVNYAKELLAQELAARKKVEAILFPKAREGVNRRELPFGYTLKLTRKLEREVNEELLPSVREPLSKAGVSLDSLVKYKAKLEVTAYRQLTAEQAAIFNDALTTKAGAPTLQVEAPEEEK